MKWGFLGLKGLLTCIRRVGHNIRARCGIQVRKRLKNRKEISMNKRRPETWI